jgi:Phosphoesterase family
MPAAASAMTTKNLLANGDAELHRCTDDWTAQSSVPGWRVVRGAASVLCYSAFSTAGETAFTPSNAPAGRALFAGPGADTAMEQIVDVGAAGAAIDGGTVGFRLSGWLGGWRDRPERATLTAVFLDATGHATGAPVVIADVDAQARHDSTGLVQRQADGLVPPATRQIVVTVQLLSGMTSFHDAYADNLRLTLSGDVRGLAAAAAVPPASEIPALDHVVVVMMENTNYADVLRTTGSSVTVDSRMPFLASLASRGVILTNTWQTYHPSDQNYVAMVAGDTFKYGPVYYPDYDLPVAHLGDLLSARGKSWAGYVQYMGTPCNPDSVGDEQLSFSPDDEPFVHFHDVIANDRRCAAHVRDLTDFESAIAGSRLPDFSWVAADNWWDGEGAWYDAYDVGFSNAMQDQFLQSALEPLVDSAQWQTSRSLLIVTWDEADGWGWPDNHVPTILVGSPGLLQAGTVAYDHVNGYDLLRTIESALGVGSLGTFDKFAQPLSSVFTGARSLDAGPAHRLWPAEAVATRGSIDDTFGTATTPAAVDQGDPLTLVVPAGVASGTVVNLEPLGRVPTSSSTPYSFSNDNVSVSIPTRRLQPGVYGAWLRRGAEPPHLAPMMATILPPALVSAARPGVEIVGAPAGAGDAAKVSLREGSNPIVRYCRPRGAAAADTWIGIFEAGTPPDQMTQDNANVIGFWLKTPGGGGERQPCGEAEAYASELTPGQDYEVLLFENAADGTATAIGSAAAFTLTPALPSAAVAQPSQEAGRKSKHRRRGSSR